MRGAQAGLSFLCGAQRAGRAYIPAQANGAAPAFGQRSRKMNALRMSNDEMNAILRRAEAERAAAIRKMFAAAWRGVANAVVWGVAALTHAKAGRRTA
ncbi:RSP_7527 family protein [Oceanicella actignis]